MDGVKWHYATYTKLSLVFYVLGNGALLSRNVLLSTVQYKKRALLKSFCSSVPINVSTLCPASLVSILMRRWLQGGFGVRNLTR